MTNGIGKHESKKTTVKKTPKRPKKAKRTVRK